MTNPDWRRRHLLKLATVGSLGSVVPTRSALAARDDSLIRFALIGDTPYNVDVEHSLRDVMRRGRH